MIIAGLTNFLKENNSSFIDKINKVVSNLFEKQFSFIKKTHFSLFLSQSAQEEIVMTENSLLLGRVFNKKDYSPVRSDDLKFIEKEKNRIFDFWWGSYVLFTEEKSVLNILIDPAGHGELYYFKLPDGNFFFASDINIISSVVQETLSLNWSYLSVFVTYGYYYPCSTFLKEVNTLPRGCCLSLIRQNEKVSLGWNPQSYMNSSLYQREDTDFVERMSKVLKAWIKPYQETFLSFSGGLDSSSLLYCLSTIVEPTQKLKLFNYFTRNFVSSIEIEHAEKVVRELGLSLLALDLTDYSFFSPPNPFKYKPNRPLTSLAFQKYQEEMNNKIGVKENSLIISGHGGDNVFMRSPPFSSVTDAFLDIGIKRAFNILKELCFIYRESLIKVSCKNFSILGKHCLRLPHKLKPEDPYTDWMKHEMIKLSKISLSHHIYKHLDILPGKKDHFDGIYRSFDVIQSSSLKGFEPIFYPFLAQPIVEWALSLPTYQLYGKGFDRLPVRMSISNAFHTDTVWRIDKGSTTGHVLLGIRENYDFVRDICLNGAFIKEGLIEKSCLERHLQRLSAGDASDLWPFIHLYCTEVFLRAWGNPKSF